MPTTRGLGLGANAAALNRINDASNAAPVKLDAQGVAEVKAGLAQEARSLIAEFNKLKADGDTAGMQKLLNEQDVGAKIDKFVLDVEKDNAIDLPDGTSATDVVSDAVAAFLEAGFTYKIDFGYQIGGRELHAKLDDGGNVDWNDIRMR